jgi:hypothetical protein
LVESQFFQYAEDAAVMQKANKSEFDIEYYLECVVDGEFEEVRD